MGRTDFFHDPRAPKANSLVPAAGILAEDEQGRLGKLLPATRAAANRSRRGNGCGSGSLGLV